MTQRDDLRAMQQVRDVPPSFGRTRDMTPVIAALAKAEMPGAEVTSFNHLTLGDGRVALVTNISPYWPAVAIDQIPPRHDLVLVTDTAIRAPVVQLARSTPKGILLVDLRGGLVWDEGRLVSGKAPRRDEARHRYAVFATTKVIVRHGGGIDRVMSMAGLTRQEVEESLEIINNMLEDFGSGRQAKWSDDLLDWILACYSGAGGVSTWWKSDLPLDLQAELIRAYADMRLSGAWAAHQQLASIDPSMLTVFAPSGADLDPLGFRPGNLA